MKLEFAVKDSYSDPRFGDDQNTIQITSNASYHLGLLNFQMSYVHTISQVFGENSLRSDVDAVAVSVTRPF